MVVTVDVGRIVIVVGTTIDVTEPEIVVATVSNSGVALCVAVDENIRVTDVVVVVRAAVV